MNFTTDATRISVVFVPRLEHWVAWDMDRPHLFASAPTKRGALAAVSSLTAFDPEDDAAPIWEKPDD